MSKLVVPDPAVPELVYDDSMAVVFLAGPIQSAPDWQAQAAAQLFSGYHGKRELVVCSPRAEPYHGDYNYQVDWETRHLERAAMRGVIMFWLAKESEHVCDRAYAQTSRFEIGEWFSRRTQNHHIDLAIGIEPGFTGERYLRRRLNYIFNSTISSTLEKTCEHAVALLKYRDSV